MKRGNNVFADLKSILPVTGIVNPTSTPVVNDAFMHAFFSRIALEDNRTIEFETRYDKETNTIELFIPDDVLPVLDQIVGIQQGERLRCYIDWLLRGSQSQSGLNQDGVKVTVADPGITSVTTVLDTRTVVDVGVYVVTAFDGATPSIIIGTPASPALFFVAGDSDLKVADRLFTKSFNIDGEIDIIGTLTLGGSSVGEAIIRVVTSPRVK